MAKSKVKVQAEALRAKPEPVGGPGARPELITPCLDKILAEYSGQYGSDIVCSGAREELRRLKDK